MEVNNTSTIKRVERVINKDSEEIKREYIREITDMDAEEIRKEYISVASSMDLKKTEREHVIKVLSNKDIG